MVLGTRPWPALVGFSGAVWGRVAESEDLVERCKAGEAEAFRQLFRLHRVEVVRLVQRMLGRTSELEDVVQEVFLQVHRSIRDFRGQARFTTWLYRVAVNVVLMHRRAARSRPVFSAASDVQVALDARPLPDEQVARRKRIGAFYRLLDRLTEKKRTVFVLHELEGVPPAEIAKIVDAPVLTVRTRLFYARRELAALLREEPDLAAVADEIITATSGAPKDRESAG
jgi:RNA polymerase sigma-70 factor (ECF subfamily)